MAFRHEVLHVRRQKQRLIDIPGPKILAHSQRLNQTRLELNSDYSDRLLAQVFRMSVAEAETTFKNIRWADTNGTPVCPSCGSVEAYEARRPNGALRFRCKGCKKDFTITSGTLFASHKLPLRGYLAAIAVFCNEVKGKSALALSRDLHLSYKSAFVLLHKLREAMAEEMRGRVVGGEGKVT